MIEVEGGEGGRDGSSSGLGGRRGRLHVPSRFDNNSLYNSLSLATSDPSWVISGPIKSFELQLVLIQLLGQPEIRSSNLIMRNQQSIHYGMFAYPRLYCSRYHKPDFYWIHWTIHPSTINLDRVSDGSNDYSRISLAIGCYMFPEKKPVSRFKKKIT
jgi:hypothetical protein